MGDLLFFTWILWLQTVLTHTNTIWQLFCVCFVELNIFFPARRLTQLLLFFGKTNYLTLFMTTKAQSSRIHESNLYGIMTFVTPYLILSNGSV